MYVQAVAKCVNPFKINPTNSESKCVQYVCEISPKGEAVSQEEAGPKLQQQAGCELESGCQAVGLRCQKGHLGRGQKSFNTDPQAMS